MSDHDVHLELVRAPASPYTSGWRARCHTHSWAGPVREHESTTALDLYRHITDSKEETS